MAKQNFEPIEEPDDESNVTPLPSVSRQPIGEKFAIDALTLGLTTLSKRMIVALADLFMLATVGSAFWLWWMTPDPNPYQITSLTIYGVFVLTANWIVRRK